MSEQVGGRAVTLVSARKFGATVVVMFLVISFWSNPSGSATAFADFIGEVGGFFSSVIDKTAAFIHGLVN
jgi:hypothetical protein